MPSFDVITGAQNLFGQTGVSYGRTVMDMDYGMNPETFYDGLYRSYLPIGNHVQTIVEAALGITHDLYHEWVKYKGTLNDAAKKGSPDYDGTIKRFSTQINYHYIASNYSIKDGVGNTNPMNGAELLSFSSFVELVQQSSSSHKNPAYFLNYKKFLDSISELRSNLAEVQNGFTYPDDYNNPENRVLIDVGTSSNEFPMASFVSAGAWNRSVLPSFAFTIEPSVAAFDGTSMESIGFENSLPLIRQRVFVDINRLVCTFAKLFPPDNLPEYLSLCEQERSEYIKNGLLLFKNLPDLITRKIMLELYDNYEGLKKNWSHFLSRFDQTYQKLAESDDIINATNKLRFYGYKMHNVIVPTIIEGLTEEGANNFFRINYLNDTLVAINNGFKIEYPGSTKDITSALFLKAFKTMFTTGALHIIAVENENYEPVISTTEETVAPPANSKIVVKYYTKEFFDQYNRSSLLDTTRSIPNYNVRDFFQSLINDNLGEFCRPYPSRLKSGENSYFLFSKLRRVLWIDIACLMNILLNASHLNTSCKEERGQNAVTDKLSTTISNNIRSLIENIISVIIAETTSFWPTNYHFRTHTMHKKLRGIRDLYLSVVGVSDVSEFPLRPASGILPLSRNDLSKFDSYEIDEDRNELKLLVEQVKAHIMQSAIGHGFISIGD